MALRRTSGLTSAATRLSVAPAADGSITSSRIVRRRNPGHAAPQRWICSRADLSDCQTGGDTVWRHELGTFAVDFSRQGGEFAHHVCAQFGQTFMSGHGTDGTCPVVLGPPLDPSITSALEVYPH